MAKIYGGLERIIGSPEFDLPIDSLGINIFNFPEYVLNFRTKNLPFSDLRDPKIDELTTDEISSIQWDLIKKQIEFAHNTTPVINYLWSQIYKIKPSDIKDWSDFQKIPPITKEHMRKLGWQNFIPAPIASMYLQSLPEGRSIDEIDPNLIPAQEKWTGGTTAKNAEDYVHCIIPDADWRGSVDTMERILYPIADTVRNINIAATTYDMRHIARPIFEAQLRRYGVFQLARPPDISDDNWLKIIESVDAHAAVASPRDHPLKGISWSGMLYGAGNRFTLALMSSTVPEESMLQKMLEYGISVLNVGGDTISLPTYYSLVSPDNKNTIDDSLEELKKIKVIQIGPAYTEIVCGNDLSFSKVREEGVLLQTNYASVWKDTKTGEKYIVPALKTQAIRSSAPGNLVTVMEVDKFNRPTSFYHEIERLNDFLLTNMKPVYGNPHSKGGISRGGCAG